MTPFRPRPLPLAALCAAIALPGCLVPDERSTTRWVSPETPEADAEVKPPQADADAPTDVSVPVGDATATLDQGLPSPDGAPPTPDAMLEPDLGPPVERPAACGTPATGAATHAGGGRVEAGVDAGSFVGAAVDVPGDALDVDATLTIACADAIVRDGFTPLGPALQITASPSAKLGRRARVTLVFSAPDKPDRVEDRHLRLFWKPSNYGYVAEPPVMDLVHDLRAGTFSFVTPAFGTFQVGYANDAGEPVQRRFTYKAIGGVSMGSGGAAYLGMKYPQYFDYLIPLGGLTDQAYMLHYIRNRLMGGFCRDGEGGGIGSWCGLPTPTNPLEHASDYLYWYYDDSEGAGGNFDRSEYVKIFQDLAYAYGNLLLYNPESPYLPPGTPAEDLLLDWGTRCSAECRGDDCQVTPPRTLPPGTFFDDEYNPRGEYPVIAFCDGEDSDPRGVLGGERPNAVPLEVAYAVDVDGNGRRDLHEPVIRNMYEPYRDHGCDAVASPDEPGYDAETNPDPHGDDYDWYRNPNGTESNFVYDDCGMGQAEAYDDLGLDGVADTPQFADGGYDHGEGNGRFDYNPNVARYLERNPGFLFRDLPVEDRERLRIWADGGVRDLFNFAIDTAHFSGHLQGAGQNVRIYNDFPKLFQGLVDDGAAFFPNARHKDAFGRRGQSVFLAYGNPDADAFDVSQGDGAHVGTVVQALNRFMSMFEWVHNRWPGGDYSKIEGAFNREDGVVFFDSRRFGKTYRFGISLPPGYGDPANAGVRYPVLLVLHGYGQGPEDLPVTGAILAAQMAGGLWQKSIVVFPEGFCGSAAVFQCNDGIDNDGDGAVDSSAEGALRRECATDDDCVGTYRCENGWCCSQDIAVCGPPDADCGNNREGHSEGGGVTLCSDGVDNDRDGRLDLEDEGCLNSPAQDSEADCKKGAFYTQHPSAKDGSPGGPDFEGAMVDMLEYLDANYRTKRPEVLTVPR